MNIINGLLFSLEIILYTIIRDDTIITNRLISSVKFHIAHANLYRKSFSYKYSKLIDVQLFFSFCAINADFNLQLSIEQVPIRD